MSARKFLTDIYVILKINILSLRSAFVPYLVISVILPLGFTYLVSLAFGGRVPFEAAVNMLIGATILSLSLSLVNGMGQSIAQDIMLGRLELLASYPIRPAAYVIGLSVMFLLAGLLNTAIIVLTGTIAWGLPQKTMAALPGLLVVAAIASIGLMGISAIIGTRSRSLTQAYAYTNVLSFIIALLTPAYYSPKIMPSAIRYLSYVLPTTHASLIARDLLGAGSYDVTWYGTLLVVLSIAYLAAGLSGIKWRYD